MKIKLNTSQYSFFLVSLAVLVSLPFGYFWSSLFAGIWSVHAVFWYFNSYPKVHFNLPFFLWTLFCVYLFLSPFWSGNSSESLSAMSKKLLLLVIPLCGFFSSNIHRDTLKKLLHYFSVFLAVMAIVLFLLAYQKWFTYQFDAFLFYHELVSPLELNAIYVSYIFSVVWLTNFILIKSYNWLNIIYQIILALFLILLSSKNILFITLLIFGVLLYSTIDSKKLKFSIVGGTVVLIVLILITQNPIKTRFLKEFRTSAEEIFQKSNFDDRKSFTGTEARLLQIRAYISQNKTNTELWFGEGIGNSQSKLMQFHKNLDTPESYQNYNYHNQYLQILSEAGIVGLALFISFLIALGFLVRKDKTFLGFFLVSISLFLTESVLWRQRGIIFFSLFLVFMLKYKFDEGQLRN